MAVCSTYHYPFPPALGTGTFAAGPQPSCGWPCPTSMYVDLLLLPKGFPLSHGPSMGSCKDPMHPLHRQPRLVHRPLLIPDAGAGYLHPGRLEAPGLRPMAL